MLNLEVNLNSVNKNGETYLMTLLKKFFTKETNKNSIVNKSDVPLNIQLDTMLPRSVESLDFYRKDIPKSKSTNVSELDFNETVLSFFVKLIQHKNVDVNKPDFTGNNILMLSSEQDNVCIVKLVLSSSNININAQNYLGETALMLAVKKRVWRNVELLIEKGADYKIKNIKGLTAKDYINNETDLSIYKQLTGDNSTLNSIHPINDISDNLIGGDTKKAWFF
jgi:ankyrin repeat protein